MLDPVKVTRPVADIDTLPVDDNNPDPGPVEIKVLAITLPLAITFVELILTAPAAVMVILPEDEIKPAEALVETKPLAITLPLTFKLPVTDETLTADRFAEIRPFAAIEILSPATRAPIALALLKYTLPELVFPDSITLPVNTLWKETLPVLAPSNWPLLPPLPLIKLTSILRAIS
jgi:hypothetical protein